MHRLFGHAEECFYFENLVSESLYLGWVLTFHTSELCFSFVSVTNTGIRVTSVLKPSETLTNHASFKNESEELECELMTPFFR